MRNKGASFNLIDEPWIKVRDGMGVTRELSILEVFSRAHELTCLANDLPTQDFAILRMLEAILQRSVASQIDEYEYPSDMWGDYWSAAQIPMDSVNEYLGRWYHRFDLFDDKEPFMQVAGMRSSNNTVAEVKKILADVPDGLPLFSLRSGDSLNAMNYAEAARWLLHVHAFDTSGIKTGMVGDSSVKGGKSYPIGTGWAGAIGGVFAEGQSLFETLLLNLCLCEDCKDNPDDFLDVEDDVPVWEQGQKQLGNDVRAPFGYADLYTWQSRRVLLVEKDGEVRGVLLTNGDKLEPYNKRVYEPMTAWRRSIPQEKRLRITPVYMPKTHTKERAMWRGLTALLPSQERSSKDDYFAPGIAYWVGHLASVNGGEKIPTSYRVRMRAVGYEYGVQNAVFTELIDDSLQLNTLLLTPEGADASALAIECMSQTDVAVGALGYFAQKLKLACGMDAPLAAEARKVVIQEAYYELDSLFRVWLSTLNNDRLLEAKVGWYEQAKRAVGGLGRGLVEQSDAQVIVGRKVERNRREEWVSAGRAEAQFWYALNRALPSIEQKPLDEGRGEEV